MKNNVNVPIFVYLKKHIFDEKIVNENYIFGN